MGLGYFAPGGAVIQDGEFNYAGAESIAVSGTLTKTIDIGGEFQRGFINAYVPNAAFKTADRRKWCFITFENTQDSASVACAWDLRTTAIHTYTRSDNRRSFRRRGDDAFLTNSGLNQNGVGGIRIEDVWISDGKINLEFFNSGGAADDLFLRGRYVVWNEL